MIQFMGKSMNYWEELHKNARRLNVESLLDDNARLRAKVSLYEQHLFDMMRFKTHMEAK